MIFISTKSEVYLQKQLFKAFLIAQSVLNMDTFGKKLKECREAKGLSQAKFAKEVGLHHSIIGRYEREEAKPTIDVVKRMAVALDTTVGYLLSETADRDLLKDPAMLKRLNEISGFTDEDKNHILYTLDAMIKSVKLKNIAAL